MSRTNTDRFLPFEADMKQLKQYRKITTGLIRTVGVCSVVLPVVNSFIGYNWVNFLYNVINLIYFLVIIAYYILDTYTETFLYPATARKRRKGYIDNSLGSRFLEQEATWYFTNDRLKYGPYKMIVNCAENCYFTKNIAREMKAQVILKNGLYIVVFLSIAYFGIQNNKIAIPMLQILLSSTFLTELIHHFNFVTKLDQQFERFLSFFSQKSNDEQILQEAILFLLDYETTLAYNKAPLSDDIYKRLRSKLTREWEDIKKRYGIYQ